MEWTWHHLPTIGVALWQHVVLSVVSVGIALVLSLGLGIWSARRPRLYGAILGLTGAVFVVPSLALFALLIPLLGLGTVPAVVGLSSYCLLILVRNTVTGLRGVAPEVLDAADGMGYGRGRRLREIELPLALPTIVAGVRIATVTVIGIATVAAYINAGGLGTIIFEGIDQRFLEKILVGGLLTSALAIGADLLLGWFERALGAGRG